MKIGEFKPEGCRRDWEELKFFHCRDQAANQNDNMDTPPAVWMHLFGCVTISHLFLLLSSIKCWSIGFCSVIFTIKLSLRKFHKSLPRRQVYQWRTCLRCKRFRGGVRGGPSYIIYTKSPPLEKKLGWTWCVRKSWHFFACNFQLSCHFVIMGKV